MNSRSTLPVGTVIPYAGPVYATDSGGSGGGSGADGDPNDPLVNQQIAANLASSGWLVCDGQTLYAQDYPLLYSVIGIIYGGDEDNTGKSFKVPDYQGLFLRRTNAEAGRDPNAADRTAPDDCCTTIGDTVGSVQNDAFQGHQHHYMMPNTPLAVVGSEKPPPSAVPSVKANTPTTDFIENGSDGEPRTSSETRAKNIYINFLIKAF